MNGAKTAVHFRRRLACVLLAGVTMAVFLNVAGRYYTFAIAHQQCLPWTFWFIEKGVIPKKGEYAYFSGNGIPRYGSHVRLVKLLSGATGDTVTVRIPEREEVRILDVNGITGRYRMRASLTLSDAYGTKREYPVFRNGSDGRQLPFVYGEGTTRIERGYFVTGTHPASYDSRYWGPIDETAILGKAHPLL